MLFSGIAGKAEGLQVAQIVAAALGQWDTVVDSQILVLLGADQEQFLSSLPKLADPNSMSRPETAQKVAGTGHMVADCHTGTYSL